MAANIGPIVFGGYTLPSSLRPSSHPSSNDLADVALPRRQGSVSQLQRAEAASLAVHGELYATTPNGVISIEDTVRANLQAGYQKLYWGRTDRYYIAQVKSVSDDTANGMLFGTMPTMTIEFRADDPFQWDNSGVQTSPNFAVMTTVPAMTGPSSPSGVASASGILSDGGDHEAWKAFANSSLFWASPNTGYPQWLQYEYPSPVVASSYVLVANNLASQAPSAWQFQGSTDGATWYTLDTRSGQTGWTVGVACGYGFNPAGGAYQYYRWLFSNDNDGGAGEIVLGGGCQINTSPPFYYTGTAISDPTWLIEVVTGGTGSFMVDNQTGGTAGVNMATVTGSFNSGDVITLTRGWDAALGRTYTVKVNGVNQIGILTGIIPQIAVGENIIYCYTTNGLRANTYAQYVNRYA